MPKKLVCTAPNVVEIQEYQEETVKPNQVKFRTTVGTLKHGTQLRAVRRNNLDYTKPFDKELRIHSSKAQKPEDNYLLGDSVIGEVIETGSECRRFKVGDSVYGLHRLKEVHVVDESAIRHNTFSGYQGLLFDPALAALGALREGNVRIGDMVVLIGLGAINLFCVELAKLQQAAQIIAFDPHPVKRELAKKKGALVFDPNEVDPGETVREVTGGKGADVVIEASSSYKGLSDAVRCAAVKGTVVSLSYFTRDEENIQFAGEWLRNGLMVKTYNPISHPYADYPRWDIQRLIETCRTLFEANLINGDGIINSIVSLEEAPDAIQKVIADSGSFIKIGIRFLAK